MCCPCKQYVLEESEIDWRSFFTKNLPLSQHRASSSVLEKMLVGIYEYHLLKDRGEDNTAQLDCDNHELQLTDDDRFEHAVSCQDETCDLNLGMKELSPEAGVNDIEAELRTEDIDWYGPSNEFESRCKLVEKLETKSREVFNETLDSQIIAIPSSCALLENKFLDYMDKKSSKEIKKFEVDYLENRLHSEIINGLRRLGISGFVIKGLKPEESIKTILTRSRSARKKV